MLVSQRFNILLDNLARTHLTILRRHYPSYKVCGYTGLILAIMLGACLISFLGLSYAVLAALILTAAITFFSLAMATKIIIGEERLIYYHHEIAVLITSTLLLWTLNCSILPYLDIVALGLGTFLACGRIGCLKVGCCHGLPHSWGVCYREEHADEGFTSSFVGVRLFPIQAVEMLWVSGVVIIGVLLIFRGQPPGEALAWYIIAYGVGRFCLEFLRGDPERPYFIGFSEAQWTTIVLMAAVIWAEVGGHLPFHPWYAGVTASLVIMMIIVGVKRRFRDRPTLKPQDIKEVAETVERASDGTAVEKGAKSEVNGDSIHIPVECTSFGVQISAGKIRDSRGDIHHYALSQKDGNMTETTARSLGSLIRLLRHPSDSFEVLRGGRGIFHLLFYQVE